MCRGGHLLHEEQSSGPPSAADIEAALILRTADGDRDAYAALVRLWTNAASYEPAKARVSTWLTRITANVCLDLLCHPDPARSELAAVRADICRTLDALSTRITISEYVRGRTLRGAEMNSAALTLPQRMAEDEICCACDGLSAPEALGALLEIVAQILADVDIVPGTEDYERFMLGIEKSLPPRIAQLRWDGVVPLPIERSERVADEAPTSSAEIPVSWDGFVPPPAERPEPVADDGSTLPAEIPTSWDSFVPPPAERPEPVADDGSTLPAEIPTSWDSFVSPPAERPESVADEGSVLPVIRVTSAAA